MFSVFEPIKKFSTLANSRVLPRQRPLRQAGRGQDLTSRRINSQKVTNEPHGNTGSFT